MSFSLFVRERKLGGKTSRSVSIVFQQNRKQTREREREKETERDIDRNRYKEMKNRAERLIISEIKRSLLHFQGVVLVHIHNIMKPTNSKQEQNKCSDELLALDKLP